MWNQNESFNSLELVIYDVLESPLNTDEFELRTFRTRYNYLTH